MGREILRARVADRHGRMLSEEEHRHRLADDLAAADDDRLLPSQLHSVLLEHHHHTRGRSRDEERLAEIQTAGVQNVEAVDVLVGIDGAEHRRLVHVIWKRQLDEDAVDLRVVVEVVDERENLVLRRRRIEPDVTCVDPRLRRGALLEPDVHVGRRVVTDQHRREPDVPERGDLALDLAADPLGQGLAVHQRRSHGATLLAPRSTTRTLRPCGTSSIAARSSPPFEQRPSCSSWRGSSAPTFAHGSPSGSRS